jgi:hypothetical protein
MLSVEQLKSRYPYMFSRPNIGLEFYRGWMPILEDACAEIDAVLGERKQSFHWRQIKEKWGSARFYWALGRSKRTVIDIQGEEGEVVTFNSATAKGDSVAERIDAIVDAAEAKTRKTCIVCGAPGTLQSPDGYYLTLCSLHSPTDVAGAVLS